MSVTHVLLSSLLIGSALSAESFYGRCPSVPSMKGFDMEKFEGLWYVMENFDPGEKCMTWNIVKGDSPDTWKIIETKENGVVHAAGIEHSTFNTGTITQPNKDKPAALRSSWPLSAIAGDAAFTVHMTDYDNYAGVFECQNIVFWHRQSGYVLSRNYTMNIEHRQMSRLLATGVMVEYYQRVFQGNCRYNRKKEQDNTNPDLVLEDTSSLED